MGNDPTEGTNYKHYFETYTILKYKKFSEC